MSPKIPCAEPDRQTLDKFDPFIPTTWPSEIWPYLKSNLPSTEEAVDAYRAWREECERDLRMQVLAAQLEGTKNAPEPDVEPRVLIDFPEAARLVGMTESALRKYEEKHLVAGVVRRGRRIQFHRETFLAGWERKATRR